MKKTRLKETSKVSTGSGSDIKVISVSDAQLDKINQQTLAPLSKEEVFAFSILLIDDVPTRNGTQYPESFQRTILKKEPRKGNWIGLTMLMGENEDHETKASNQKARIYDARLVKTPKGHIGTIGEAYIPINKSTKPFIDSIKAGIHREVSIGVAVEEPTCSICGDDIRECSHEPQEYYDGELCIIVMQGDAEAQEVSFVAVPGSYHAQILSDTSEYVPLTEAFGKTSIHKKERKQMATKRRKKKLSKEQVLARDINRYSRMIEARLSRASKENDEFDKEEEEDDEDTYNLNDDGDDMDQREFDDDDDEYGRSGDGDYDDEDEDDDEDDDDFNESVDDDEYDEEDDDEYDEEDDEDDEQRENDDERRENDDEKQTEALKSVYKSLRKVNERLRVIEKQASYGRQYQRKVLNETIRLGVLSKTIPLHKKESFKKTFSRLPLKELLEFQKGYKLEVERMYPATGRAVIMAERKARKRESNRHTSMGINDIVKEFNK